MSRLVLCSVCALLVMASSAAAAKIDYKGFDAATLPDDWATKYGLGGDSMVYDFSSGKPDVAKGYYYGANGNPGYVDDFYYNTPGSGSGKGSSGGNGEDFNPQGDLYYNLVLKAGKTFEFTALFYDKTYGDDNGGLADGLIAMKVRLLGENDLDDTWHEITVGQMEHGYFLTWFATIYSDDAKKMITLDIEFVNGAGQHPCGFFLDNVADAGPDPLGVIPEPATVSLVLFGMAGIFARRKKA